ncbi:MAG: hypothetical protein K9N48_04660, partial [Verrucomicrobia bacterium]|nr:hypothetical protein [Verrucomicrobiota bacterium]
MNIIKSMNALLILVVAVLFSQHAVSLNADEAYDVNVRVQLIWGTNGENPYPDKLKELEDKLKDKLKSVFKWKNYFEVSRHDIGLKKDRTKRIRISRKCELELTFTGDSNLEIKLFGEGKFVNKVRQSIAPDEHA